MPYRHLTIDERETIAQMRYAGKTQADVARALRRHPSTVCRELRRNASDRPYVCHAAQRKAEVRRQAAHRPCRMDHPPLRAYVTDKLDRAWSPEQIAGRLPLDHPRDPAMRLSPPTLYAWLARDRRGTGRWWRRLRQAFRRRNRYGTGRSRRGQIPGRVCLEQRPASADHRRRFGDWEADTLKGGRGALATWLDRRSRLVRLRKMDGLTAAAMNRAAIRALARLPKRLRRTVTVDNGKENAGFRVWRERLGLDVYFARPYHAWERGSVENAQGLIREFLPKGMDFRRVAHETVSLVEGLLNERPRKCLGYRTPLEVLRRGARVALQT